MVKLTRFFKGDMIQFDNEVGLIEDVLASEGRWKQREYEVLWSDGRKSWVYDGTASRYFKIIVGVPRPWRRIS